MKKSKYSNYFVYLIIFVISVLFVTVSSFTTSSLYPYHIGGDSPIFQTIGKYWAQGILPYTGLFDHKGPFIFFVDMLGFKLTGSSTGIYLIQIFFMLASLTGLYKLASLFSKTQLRALLFMLLTLLVLLWSYDEGNLTEEYALPFLIYSLYFQVRYLKGYNPEEVHNKSQYGKHNQVWALLYGITFAVCLLTRITNAVSVCCGVLCIMIILLKEKRWLSLLQNALGFILGFLLLFGPFAIYFQLKGTFSDFIFGMLIFNLKYSANTVPWWQEDSSLLNIAKFMIIFLPAFLAVLSGILAFIRKSAGIGFLYCLIGLLQCYIFLSGHFYSHYAMIAIPMFLCFIGEVTRLPVRWMKNALLICIICYSLTSLFKSTERLSEKYDLAQTPGVEYDELMDQVPQDESFVAYNTDRNIYLLYDREPCYSHFILQESQARYSQAYADEIHQEFSSCKADWILVRSKKVRIKDILKDKYVLKDSVNDKFFLYQRVK